VNLKPFVIVLIMVFVTLAGCGIAAIIAGIKQLRDQHRRTALDPVIWWLYLGIRVLSVVGVVIFLYGR